MQVCKDTLQMCAKTHVQVCKDIVCMFAKMHVPVSKDTCASLKRHIIHVCKRHNECIGT
jgi:hypothetical protein